MERSALGDELQLLLKSRSGAKTKRRDPYKNEELPRPQISLNLDAGHKSARISRCAIPSVEIRDTIKACGVFPALDSTLVGDGRNSPLFGAEVGSQSTTEGFCLWELRDPGSIDTF
jgi:hypothetical protein